MIGWREKLNCDQAQQSLVSLVGELQGRSCFFSNQMAKMLIVLQAQLPDEIRPKLT